MHRNLDKTVHRNLPVVASSFRTVLVRACSAGSDRRPINLRDITAALGAQLTASAPVPQVVGQPAALPAQAGLQLLAVPGVGAGAG